MPCFVSCHVESLACDTHAYHVLHTWLRKGACLCLEINLRVVSSKLENLGCFYNYLGEHRTQCTTPNTDNCQFYPYTNKKTQLVM